MQPPAGEPHTWSLETLRQQVDDLQKGCEELQMESEMLADFLHRNAEHGEDESVNRPGRGSTGKSQRKSGLPTTLSVDEKYRIANMEVEELHKDIDQTRRTSEQNLDILKALMEETDIRIKEVKRDAYEFRRDIVVGAENIRTGSTMAENVLKYLEDKLTQKDMLINKMLMKNQAYKTQIKKAEKQLKSKQETGDDLQYIDFHQLQIENQQFVVKIDAANQELLTLKRTSGKTVKALNLMKKKLARLRAGSNRPLRRWVCPSRLQATCVPSRSSKDRARRRGGRLGRAPCPYRRSSGRASGSRAWGPRWRRKQASWRDRNL